MSFTSEVNKMAPRINKNLFDESKIIKKDVILSISEITSEESFIKKFRNLNCNLWNFQPG